MFADGELRKRIADSVRTNDKTVKTPIGLLGMKKPPCCEGAGDGNRGCGNIEGRRESRFRFL